MRRAKIVCTLGPASRERPVIEELIRAGLDVARLNFSHGTHEEHRRLFATVREAADRLGKPVAVLQDLQGPKIRVGRLRGGTVRLSAGQEVTLTAEAVEGTAERIPCSYAALPRDVTPGDRVLLDDGRLELRVLRGGETEARCRVMVGGELSDHKGINLPGVKVSTPSLTDKDRADLALGVELGVDYVALSFVRQADDIRQARALAHGIPLIAKIEKPEAVDCFEEILAEADGVMVARGDLGVELGPERVPLIQKQLIEQTNRRAKLVITATEMLDSMRSRPRPTRAEASDVANAILDGTDAVMLSGETASGDYPLEAVRTMDRIIQAIEGSARYGALPQPTSMHLREATNAVSRAAVAAAEELGARAIICYTETGAAALLTSEYRPHAAILAVNSDPAICRRLALHWGVTPLLVEPAHSTDQIIGRMLAASLDAGYIARGDLVVLTLATLQQKVADLMKVHQV